MDRQRLRIVDVEGQQVADFISLKLGDPTEHLGWSKDFLEAGKKQLAGDTEREATSDEVKDLRSENRELKEVVAEMTLKNRVLKKSLTGHGEEDDP